MIKHNVFTLKAKYFLGKEDPTLEVMTKSNKVTFHMFTNFHFIYHDICFFLCRIGDYRLTSTGAANRA